jgi:hypothetical protein
MSAATLLHLAQDLEWLGCELEHYGHLHAMEGFPEAGPNWDAFREKQRGALTTADKIQRELKSAVRYNPPRLVGMDYPLNETLDSIADLLAALEEIKQSCEISVQDLPGKVRGFTRMVENYLESVGAMTA